MKAFSDQLERELKFVWLSERLEKDWPIVYKDDSKCCYNLGDIKFWIRGPDKYNLDKRTLYTVVDSKINKILNQGYMPEIFDKLPNLIKERLIFEIELL